MRLNGQIGKTWITEISIEYLIFCWCCCFYNKCRFLLKDFIVGSLLEVALAFCGPIFILCGIFFCLQSTETKE